MATLIEIILSNLHFLPLFFLILTFLFIRFSKYHRHNQHKHKSAIPTNWPVVGMLPAILQNKYRLHDYYTDILFESGGTFDFKGPWFLNLDSTFTCDPENFHHIFSKNFSNYPKGPDFRKIFNILGDGIFNSDSELWKIHREVNLSILNHPDFLNMFQDIMLKKLGKCFLPVTENYADKGILVDLQDIFQRFTFDVFSMLLLDDDPGSLTMDLPSVPSQSAFFDIERALVQRHITPEWFWRFQNWIGFGLERKLRDGIAVVDHYIYHCMEKKKKKKETGTFNTITAFMNGYKQKSLSSNSTTFNSSTITKLFLRDAVLNAFTAGKDGISSTLAWFVFLLANNPGVEAMILQEIEGLRWNQIVGSMNEYSPRLIYLHAAICETLRLFPAVALERKAAVKPDILPSGACIDSKKMIGLSFYSTGRMESVWGKDCLEFKPERWITEQGRIKHEPSFKFPAFNSGPRTCLGKDITFLMIKMVAVALISSYHVELLQGQTVIPSDSVIIHMKYGLKVKLRKRI